MTNFIRNIMQKRAKEKKEATVPRQPLNEATTAPLTAAELMELANAPHHVEPSQLVVACARNVGRQRDNNEDSLFVNSAVLSVNSVNLPFGVFVVADGMGGHRQGHIASESAARAMGTFLVSKLHTALFGPEPYTPDESLQEIMRMGVAHAQDAITQNAPGGGTTLTAILVVGTQMTVAHVGDSRAYAVYLDGRIQTLTRDHSLVKRLEELGQISAQEAAIHPQKSMLYRALGQGDPSEPDIFTAPLPHPGYLLICSDGLWGVVPEAEIFGLITSAANLHQACQALVDAANAAGGPDNITAILVRMTD